jgi:hypothetical protein
MGAEKYGKDCPQNEEAIKSIPVCLKSLEALRNADSGDARASKAALSY